MFARLTVAAGLLALGALVAPHAASAATLAPQTLLPGVAESALVQVKKKHHHHGNHHRHHHSTKLLYLGLSYCAIQSTDCAERYGWHSRAYYRCLARRGC